jgi:hypothetical protein
MKKQKNEDEKVEPQETEETEVRVKESLTRNIISFNKVSKENDKFTLINENVEIIDIPGIEDGVFMEPIKDFIMKHNEEIIPILIVSLT